jgi:hypothetical protein
MTYLGQVPWTLQEDDLLREMARSGLSVAEIGKRINRSLGSIRNRALRLDIVLAKDRPVRLVQR